MTAADPLKSYSLNDAQLTAATWDSGHVLVLAGPGSGKTRTLIARAAHLLQTGTDPRQILCLTFTRRAAAELKQRLQSLVGSRANRIEAGTFHHFALVAMRTKADWFAMQDKTIIDQDDAEALFKSICAQQETERRARPKPKEIATWYSYARNSQLALSDYLGRYLELSDSDQAFVENVVASYKDRKQANGYLDFDDLLFFFALGLKKQPKIRDWLKRRYRHILVDEMQDTNPLQWLILDALRDPAKLYCVGDDAQSIYAFRGADFRNVHAFTERIPESDIVRLDLNYRSYQEILDAAGWLLSTSPLPYDKQLVADRGACGDLPSVIDFDSEGDEADWIAQQILERRQEGRAWADHLVLTRAMYLARSIEVAFLEARIPYVIRGGRTFLQAAHVKDVLALLRIAVNVRDELAWIRFLELWPGIGERTAAQISHAVLEHGDLARALQGSRARQAVAGDIQAAYVRSRQQVAEPTRLVEQAVEVLRDRLQDRYREDWDKRQGDLELLKQVATRFSSAESFLDVTTLDPVFSSQINATDDPDVVTLATIHAAKGTEARTCFICRAEPGHFPYHRSLADPDEVEEERRILYVAMTRAQDELFLTRTMRAGGRRLAAVLETREPGTSYFLDRAPETHFQLKRQEPEGTWMWDWDDDLIE